MVELWAYVCNAYHSDIYLDNSHAKSECKSHYLINSTLYSYVFVVYWLDS